MLLPSVSLELLPDKGSLHFTKQTSPSHDETNSNSVISSDFEEESDEEKEPIDSERSQSSRASRPSTTTTTQEEDHSSDVVQKDTSDLINEEVAATITKDWFNVTKVNNLHQSNLNRINSLFASVDKIEPGLKLESGQTDNPESNLEELEDSFDWMKDPPGWATTRWKDQSKRPKENQDLELIVQLGNDQPEFRLNADEHEDGGFFGPEEKTLVSADYPDYDEIQVQFDADGM